MSLREEAGSGVSAAATLHGSLERHIGRQLQRRRLALGLSCADLARAIGVTLQQVRNYERGVNRLGAARLHDLGVALGVPVGYFFAGLNEEEAAEPAEDGGARRAETVALLRAYAAIPLPARRRVLGLLRQLADAEEAKARPISKID